MRYAILSDIHANPLALDAVLADIEGRGGVDGYLVLGDLVAQGHDPIPVAERLRSLPNALFVRGNTERYVTERALPEWMDIENAAPERRARLVVAAQSHAWTTGCLSASGHLQWIKSLPLEQRLILPDGTRVLCVHASPVSDDGDGMNPGQSDEELSQLLDGCEADLVLAGHIHWAMDRQVGQVRVVNPGSTSYSWWPDLRGSYAIIVADTSGYEVALHRVDLDIDAIIASIWASDFYPNPEWLVGRYTKVLFAPWDPNRL